MDQVEEVKAALNEWMEGLDAGDLPRMVRTCDPEVVICNERQPTTVGVEALEAKYGPRIAAGSFENTFDIEHIKVYGDLALIVGRFEVQFTERASGSVGGGKGRLVLVYRRHPDGSWKLLLDVDNNNETDAP